MILRNHTLSVLFTSLFLLIAGTVRSQCTVYSVSSTGATTFCAGAVGPTINLANSVTGVNYQLKIGTVNIGTAKPGKTGSALSWSWSSNTTPGTYTYTISATKPTAPACSATMNGNVVVTINPLPTISAVGGVTCGTGTVPIQVTSNLASIFRLYTTSVGGTATASPTASASYSFTAPSSNVSKTYYVTAAIGVCESARKSVVATVAPLQAFSVTGGGALTSQTPTTSISLSGSQVAVKYQLQLNGLNEGAEVVGNGSALLWNVTVQGNYSIVAKAGTCAPKNMNGVAKVTYGLVDDALEFSALKDIYMATNGANWFNNTNWPTSWPAFATADQFGTWYGITVTDGDVTSFSMNSNNMANSLPVTLNKLSRLNIFSVGGNALSGSFPSALLDIPTLTWVALGYNQFTGDTPSFTNAKCNMSYLHLGFTHFSGPMPDLSSQTNLSTLIFWGTNFTSGPIPSWLSGLVALQNLNLNACGLTGEIPSFFGQMGLTNLELAGNQLTGNIPAELTHCSNLTAIDLSNNKLQGSLADLTILPLSSVNVSNNYFDFSVIEPLKQRVSNFSYLPQGEVNDFPNAVDFTLTKPLIINARKVTPNTITVWEKRQPDGSWLNVDGLNEDPTKATFKKNKPAMEDEGFYRWRMINSLIADLTIQSAPIQFVSLEKKIDDAISIAPKSTIPEVFKIDSYGQFATAGPVVAALFELNEAVAGKSFPVPVPCDGEYYVAFELEYQVTDEKKTQELWFRQVDVSFYNNSQLLWSGKVQVNTRNQTFVSTGFYPEPISCNGGANSYSLVVTAINSIGEAPEVSISMDALEFKKRDKFSEIAAPTSITCQLDASEGTVIVAGYAGLANATEYDIEWVFVDNADIATIGDSPAVFSKKEAARVTLSNPTFSHKLAYPEGKVWYQVRGAGYSINAPQQRITSAWTSCPAGVTVTNLDVSKNWQVQTVFAEDGKYKKVVQFLDGTTRARQSLTNLSSDNVTLVGETLYDFEGRKSVEVLATPVSVGGKFSNSLNYKQSVNRFMDQIGNKIKAYYDNGKAVNKFLDNTSGAALYYSANNPLRTSPIINTNNAYIPGAEGYAYSQVEYLNDGTGRIKRQAGVGKEFAMDKQDGDKNNEHTTKHYYGSAASQELVRLFGVDNVGNASHYKKNLVQDANRQVNVTYLDQAGQVIATALAGDKPANVDALASFTEAYNKTENIVVDLSDASKTIIEGNKKIISHKILNAARNTKYDFSYSLKALAADMGKLGCEKCKFDLSIDVVDPNGNSLIISDDYPNGGYLIKDLTADCDKNQPFNFHDVLLTDVGDYTLTKVLTAKELSFDELKELVLKEADAKAEIQKLEETYVPDLTKCDVCTPPACSDPNLVNNIIEETASQDCENVLRKIVQDVKDTMLKNGYPDYEPTQVDKETHPAWCQYTLCVKNKPSNVFERQMAIVDGWDSAVAGYGNADALVDKDPFFLTGLSGYGLASAMKEKLANIVVDDKKTLKGALASITDHTNAAYWVVADGSGKPSSTSGIHVLYYYLMTETPRRPDYDKQLGKQRWSLYQSFYLQAKRQLMVERTEYNTCQAAKDDFLSIDNLPKTEEEIANLGKGLGNISDIELTIWVDKLVGQCTSITDPEKNSIKENLRTYFDTPKAKPSSGPWMNSGFGSNNIFKIILKNDLASPINANLGAINAILAKCSKSVADFAVDDPAACENTSPPKSVSVPTTNLVLNPQFSLTGSQCSTGSVNCYTGWKAVSGAPKVTIDPSGNYATLNAAKCDENSSALLGNLTSQLIPGSIYKLNFSYQSSTGLEFSDKLLLQFTNSESYTKIRRGMGSNCTDCNTLPAAARNSNGYVANADGDGGCIGSCPNFVDLSINKSSIIENDQTGITITATASYAVTDNQTMDVVLTGGTMGAADYQLTAGKITIENGRTSGSIVFKPIEDALIEGDETATFKLANPSSGIVLIDKTVPILIVDNDSPSVNLFVNSNFVTEGSNVTLTAKSTSPAPYDLSFKLIVAGTCIVTSDYLCSLSITIPKGSTEGTTVFNALDDGIIEIDEIASIKLTNVPGSGTPIPIVHDTENITIRDNKCCTMPTVSSPTSDQFNNLLGIVEKDNIGLWRSFSIEFTAKDASRFFVFSLISGADSKALNIKNIQIVPLSPQNITYCTNYVVDPLLPATADDYLRDAKQKCIDNITAQNDALKEAAKNKIIETYATSVYNNLQTQCLSKTKETLSYSFKPLEYHYTLYYHDQAGNLVQTVPPAGVQFGNGPPPQHTLVTRYEYSTLNQLQKETTPDAGTSQHWYNAKSQQRLSQNAQQALENKYAYTKYDDQGRVIEVGEMASTASIETLKTALENKDFPLASAYTLTDVTKTHYDFPSDNTAQPLAWTHLLNVTVDETGTTLTSSSGGYWQDKAFSQNSIPANANGYVEFKVGALAAGIGSSDFALGLSTDFKPNCYDIDFGIYVQGGNVYLAENSYAGSVIANYVLSDVFRIERDGTTIRYRKNGDEFHSTTLAATGALYIDCNLNSQFSQVTNVKLVVTDAVGNAQPLLAQQNLRSRVSWVEVLDKGATVPTTTQYSYDIHGNVKTLLQQLPGLTPKRTDYLYDLVSGKVNFVMYQFGNTDQFIHKYSYDADNRLTEVATSTDRYLFNRDARYTYYLHGPLARIELGHHRVQGLDYYYTLQGWLKGVNSPTGTAAQDNDPGKDGIGTSLVGRDVFGYNLGYYQGDYKPVGDVANALVENNSPLLWSGVGGEARNLYNGNIAWMATDLAKIGQLSKNRNLGVQAMRYQYDQLHRITASTSLAVFSPATGFAARTNLYDEQYTYDANGNLLTLTRNDDKAAQRDNLQYNYFANTNKLQSLRNGSSTLTYTGEVTSNARVYPNIEVGENAYLKAGADVELRATNAIRFHPNFSKAQGNSMYAHIVGAETLEYRYDAIGNLIADGEQGITISWTPYGKVRQVRSTRDNVTVSYRYDASGNRTEKKVTTLTPPSSGAGAGGETTTTLRYVRDASGNVMSIYKNDQLNEVPIYGSSRLGEYKGLPLSPGDAGGGVAEGSHIFGLRRYELANHLSNVLTVISDKVGMKADSVWATVLSASDYYPFGLEMKGRTWTDSTYRYGFNGKEKDASFGGSAVYDYGFRIYNPEIGKFLSVDPLTKKYPWYTPYQFAGNKPIEAIDLDGLEEIHYTLVINKGQEPKLTLTKIETNKRNNLRFFVTVQDEDAEFDEETFEFTENPWRGAGLSNSIDNFVDWYANNEDHPRSFGNYFLSNEASILINFGSAAMSYGLSKSIRTKSNTPEPKNNRPTWRDSETDALIGTDYEPQVSFKNGRVVASGRRGSVRPEGYRPGSSIEVKNFDITSKSGRYNLYKNVTKQVLSRATNLPKGTVQTIIIDVRGQKVNQGLLNSTRNKLQTLTGSKNININFKTD